MSDKRMLLFEPDMAFGYLLQYVFSMEGWKVVAVQTLKDFRQNVDHRFDLFVINYQPTPRLALKLCRQLTKSPKTKDIPVIVFVPNYNKRIEKLVKQAGAKDTFLKGHESLDDLFDLCSTFTREH